MVGLPRHSHFNVPLQATFLQSFRETGHLFHAERSLGRKPSTAIKSNEPLAQESNPHFSGLLRRAWGYGVYILPTRVLMGYATQFKRLKIDGWLLFYVAVSDNSAI